jgi:hypothetical protein
MKTRGSTASTPESQMRPLDERELEHVAAAGSKKGASGAAGFQSNPKPKPQ